MGGTVGTVGTVHSSQDLTLDGVITSPLFNTDKKIGVSPISSVSYGKVHENRGCHKVFKCNRSKCVKRINQNKSFIGIECPSRTELSKGIGCITSSFLDIKKHMVRTIESCDRDGKVHSSIHLE